MQNPDQLSLFDPDAKPDEETTGAAEPVRLADAGRLARLDHRSLACVLLRYGSDPRSLADTGLAMGGLNRTEVRRLERDALDHLVSDRDQAA